MIPHSKGLLLLFYLCLLIISFCRIFSANTSFYFVIYAYLICHNGLSPSVRLLNSCFTFSTDLNFSVFFFLNWPVIRQLLFNSPFIYIGVCFCCSLVLLLFRCFLFLVNVFPLVFVCNPALFSLNSFLNFEQW